MIFHRRKKWFMCIWYRPCRDIRHANGSLFLIYLILLSRHFQSNDHNKMTISTIEQMCRCCPADHLFYFWKCSLSIINGFCVYIVVLQKHYTTPSLPLWGEIIGYIFYYENYMCISNKKIMRHSRWFFCKAKFKNI